MPLYKTITVDSHTTLWIWKITENQRDLLSGINLTHNSKERLRGMKSEMHQRGFISVRCLLKVARYEDSDLYYNNFGKPFLKNGKQISITHSYHFSAIIISNLPVGIDIEKQRDKIYNIYRKFIGKDLVEIKGALPEKVKALTIIWGVKESLYKLIALPGLSFKKHITVNIWNHAQKNVKATVSINEQVSEFTLGYLEFEGFTCVYVKP